MRFNQNNQYKTGTCLFFWGFFKQSKLQPLNFGVYVPPMRFCHPFRWRLILITTSGKVFWANFQIEKWAFPVELKLSLTDDRAICEGKLEKWLSAADQWLNAWQSIFTLAKQRWEKWWDAAPYTARMLTSVFPILVIQSLFISNPDLGPDQKPYRITYELT